MMGGSAFRARGAGLMGNPATKSRRSAGAGGNVGTYIVVALLVIMLLGLMTVTVFKKDRPVRGHDDLACAIVSCGNLALVHAKNEILTF